MYYVLANPCAGRKGLLFSHGFLYGIIGLAVFERLVVAINGHEDDIRIPSNRGCVCVCVRVSCYYLTKANFVILGNFARGSCGFVYKKEGWA